MPGARHTPTPSCPSHTHAHTLTHSLMHTHSHTDTHTYSLTHAHSLTHTHSHSRTHTHRHKLLVPHDLPSTRPRRPQETRGIEPTCAATGGHSRDSRSRARRQMHAEAPEPHLQCSRHHSLAGQQLHHLPPKGRPTLSGAGWVHRDQSGHGCAHAQQGAPHAHPVLALEQQRGGGGRRCTPQHSTFGRARGLNYPSTVPKYPLWPP
jgi:hypothetical protein